MYVACAACMTVRAVECRPDECRPEGQPERRRFTRLDTGK
jgi:hypothetical protein